MGSTRNKYCIHVGRWKSLINIYIQKIKIFIKILFKIVFKIVYKIYIYIYLLCIKIKNKINLNQIKNW